MNGKSYLYALAITSVLCLISAGIEHFFGAKSFFLIMLGPPMVLWGLLLILLYGDSYAIPEFLGLLLLISFVVVYYSLLIMPLLIVRNSTAVAMVWAAFFLGMHFIFYCLASGMAAV